MQTSDCVKKTDTLPSLAVLLSTKPYYCDLIANDIKNIEIRKNKPNLKPPFKCYIYETKAINRKKIIVDLDGELPTTYARGRGKVIGEFICDRIEYLDMDSTGVGFWENGEFIYLKDIGWNACLSREEFIKYSEGKRLYGWHISELKIYDKPKELSEFYNRCYSGCDKCEFKSWDYSYAGECKEIVCTVSNKKPLARPPQSWCYVD